MMRSSIISIALAAVIGVIIGLLLQAPDTSTDGTTATPQTGRTAATDITTPQAATLADVNSELEALRQQLTQEIDARNKLQSTVDKLNTKIARLENQKPATENKTPEPETSPSTETQGRTWFNQQALIDAGVDAATAESIKSRFESQELEKLYLRDQATREGWYGSRRYRNELQALDAQTGDLQKELGDEAYAAYLYATGQPNQVKVQSVLANSSAATAGIQANDQILRYGEQRIYNWRDLRTATTQGNPDESVSVEVIREGKRLQLYVQRGPLGIRMNSISTAP
jgi:C-terminal processing protease CtpA/Prc